MGGSYCLHCRIVEDDYRHLVPAISAEPERVISGGPHSLVSDQRNGKGETIELLECLKSWFRWGIFTELDLHAVFNDSDEHGAAEALDDESEPVQDFLRSFRPD